MSSIPLFHLILCVGGKKFTTVLNGLKKACYFDALLKVIKITKINKTILISIKILDKEHCRGLVILLSNFAYQGCVIFINAN